MSNFATGQISRIYPADDRVWIKLDNISPEPLDGYFFLADDHRNYNALYSLALAAAVNRYEFTIRINGEIDPTKHAEIDYIFVDW